MTTHDYVVDLFLHLEQHYTKNTNLITREIKGLIADCTAVPALADDADGRVAALWALWKRRNSVRDYCE